MGNVILMGRKTFESLPKRPLPGRENVVITRNPDYHPVGVTVFTDVEEALKTLTAEGKNVFVIGGGEIYRQTIDFADRLYITHIDAEAQDADTFFPDVEKSKWEIANVSETNTDPKTGVNYSFIDYIRR